MIWRVIIFLLVFSLIVRFVLRFLIPVSKMTRMTRQHMNELQQKMDAANQHADKMNKSKRVEEDYIDYEEVK